MVPLHVDLQEGFSGDEVRLRIAGREVFHRRDVTTKLLLGVADSFRVEVPRGAVRLEVAIPSRNLSDTLEVQVQEETYLGVSVRQDRIEHVISRDPFGYG